MSEPEIGTSDERPELGASDQRPELGASDQRPGAELPPPPGTDARVPWMLASLIAQSRLVREHVQRGDGAFVVETLERREALIDELGSFAGVFPEAFRPLLAQLEEEDAETRRTLEAWRSNLGTELKEIAASRVALDGYSRLAGPQHSLFEREL